MDYASHYRANNVDFLELDCMQAEEKLRQLGYLEAAQWLFEDEFEYSSVQWFEGDLETTSFTVDDIVIVNGNLHAEMIWDCGNVDASFLIVTKDLNTRNMITSGMVLVCENLIVDELLYGNSGNDYWLDAKRIYARVVAETGHAISAGEIHAKAIIETMNRIATASEGTPVYNLRQSKNMDILCKIFNPEIVHPELGIIDQKVPYYFEEALLPIFDF